MQIHLFTSGSNYLNTTLKGISIMKRRSIDINANYILYILMDYIEGFSILVQLYFTVNKWINVLQQKKTALSCVKSHSK